MEQPESLILLALRHARSSHIAYFMLWSCPSAVTSLVFGSSPAKSHSLSWDPVKFLHFCVAFHIPFVILVHFGGSECQSDMSISEVHMEQLPVNCHC